MGVGGGSEELGVGVEGLGVGELRVSEGRGVWCGGSVLMPMSVSE